MKKVRLVLTTALISACCLGATAFAVNNTDSTEMTKNSSNRENVLIIDHPDGYEVTIGCEPIVKNDDVVVPLREFMIMTDYRLVSDEGNGGVTISNGSREITLAANSKTAVVDGKEVALDKAVYSEENLLYISVEDLEKLFSYDVAYDSKNNNVVLIVREDTPNAVKVATSPDENNTANAPATILVSVENDGVEVEADNKRVAFGDVKPFIDEDSRTQVPVRALAEMLNCRVAWDGETQEVTITDTDGKVVTVKIGDNKINAGEKIIEMDTTAKIINDRTYIPIKFVAEALGWNVFWKYAD